MRVNPINCCAPTANAKHSRQLNVLDQQTVQQTEDQHTKQTETELEQPQLHPQSELPNQGLIAQLTMSIP